jgi:antitoxin (DNA-binding transcriptional repressor) of toxin-antitoxin stability system
MRTIGSDQFKAWLGAVLRDVHEHHEEYAVTYRGRVIAHLVPATMSAAPSPELDALWAETDALAAEIGRDWPEGISAANAMAEDRVGGRFMISRETVVAYVQQAGQSLDLAEVSSEEAARLVAEGRTRRA